MMMRQKKIISPQASAKAVYLYNMLGSLCNAAFYMVLLMVVNHVSGEYQGGVFAIGYAIATQMWSIGSFETGTYQATDAKEDFQFGHYLALKIVLCVLMMAAGIGVTLVRGGTAYEQAVILLLCMFKAVDAFSGVFYSQLQKYGRLDISGKSLSIRIFLSMLVFSLALLLKQNLIVALTMACLAEVVWIASYEIRLVAPIYGMCPSFEWKRLWILACECLPLFIGSFLLIFLTNLPKYTLDAYFDVSIQAAFSALFMPAAVINLLSLFVFRPSLTRMSLLWREGKAVEFKRQMQRFLGVIAGLTVLAMVFAWMAGTQVLSLIYNVELKPYRMALTLIMLGGGFSAASTLLNYMLTILRKQRFVLVGNVVSVSVSLALCSVIVKQGGITGAALLYAISMLMLGIPLLLIVAWIMKKNNR